MLVKHSTAELCKSALQYSRTNACAHFQNKWPRTQTERYLNQLFPHPAVQVLAILETLTLPPGKRRSLIKPSTPADENDWELNDVYTELLMAALELIYRKFLCVSTADGCYTSVQSL